MNSIELATAHLSGAAWGVRIVSDGHHDLKARVHNGLTQTFGDAITFGSASHVNVSVQIGTGSASTLPLGAAGVVVLGPEALRPAALAQTVRWLFATQGNWNLILVPDSRLSGRLALARVPIPCAVFHSDRDIVRWLRLAHGYGKRAS